LVTGQWYLCSVLETYRQERSVELVALTAADEAIESTAHHPYWVIAGEGLATRPQPEHIPDAPSNAAIPGRWVASNDLRVGDVLLLRSGERVPVTALSVYQSKETLYNFHVEGLHCYAVGNKQILVHNSSGESTRDRVVANIAKSRAAREASRFGEYAEAER